MCSSICLSAGVSATRFGMMNGTLDDGLPSASSMMPHASRRKMRKVFGRGRVHALDEGHQLLPHRVALAPALDRGDHVLAGDRLAVVELEAGAQREGPQALVGAHRPLLHHLRLDLVLLVGAEQRVVDHVAVVARHELRGPDRVEDAEVRVRHHAQDLVLRACRSRQSDQAVSAARILRCIGSPPEGQFQPTMSRIDGRIAIGGFQHETNTFAPSQGRLRGVRGGRRLARRAVRRGHFRCGGGRQHSGGRRDPGAARAGAQPGRHRLGRGEPSAHVTADAFERIARRDGRRT